MAKYSSADLQKWLIEKSGQAQPAQARKMMIYNDQRGRDTAMLGKLYFFKYDPKTKDKLPMYDKFPMALAIEKSQNGFLGLNLHYLSADARQTLLDRLLVYRNNDYMDKRTKLNVSYDIINRTRGLSSLASPCVKRYLFTHCRSRFIEIYPEEYDRAVELPVEEWVFKR